MKTKFLPFLIILFSVSVSFSQTGPTDLKLMGLKGAVKSVVTTSKAISGYAEWVLNDKTKYQTTDSFDRAGNLTESLSEGQSTYRYVYSRVDGNKAFKMIEVKPSENTLRTTIIGEKEQLEGGEKRTEPDTRFDYKYVYETGNKDHTLTEKQFGNDGKLFRKRTFEYGRDGALVRMVHEDTIATMEFTYKYDAAGVLIEENETRKLKVAGADSKSRSVYSDLKLDADGNWIERKITVKSKVDALPKYNIAETESTLVSIQRRTILYY